MPEIDPARKKRLEESFIKHAALAQLYRWCQGPEHGPYALNSYTLDVMPDGRIALTAELDGYQDGALPGGATRRTPIYCTAELTPLDGTLPRIARIETSQGTGGRTGLFEAPGTRNRLLSLVHYFTSLVENPARDPAPFREVLTDDFALHYVEPPVSTHAMLDEWVTGRLASVVASNHRIHEISFEIADDDEYAVTVAMESEALFPDGSGIISKNRQSWRVIDNTAERFARIREVRIERDDMRRFDLPEAE